MHLLFLFFIGSYGVDICLPLTHEAKVDTHLSAYAHDHSHHHDEYREGEFLHIWMDGTSRMTLAHVYEREHWHHHRAEKRIFSLRDYNKKLHWTGVWNFETQKVSDCKLEVFDRPFAAYCLGKNFNKDGSGTISKDVKVDFYKGIYVNQEKQYNETLGVITESGSTSIPIQEKVEGYHHNRTYHYILEWWEHREFFDFSEAKIDPSVFAVPAGCPKTIDNSSSLK